MKLRSFKLQFYYFFFCSICFLSCNREQSIKPNEKITLSTDSKTNQRRFTEQYFVSLGNYKHFDQTSYNLYDKVCGGKVYTCGQVSYMVARHLIDPSFPVNQNEVKNIHNRLKAWGSYWNSNIKCEPDVAKLSVLANGNLYNTGDFHKQGGKFIAKPSGEGYTVQREALKEFIRDALRSNRPVLLPVRYNFSASGYGHYIIVVGIQLTAGGSGSVLYYKDVYGNNSRTKSVDYTRALNSNWSNNGRQYAAMRLK